MIPAMPIRSITLLLATIFLFSCASSYKPILPQQMTYTSLEGNEGIGYSYRYNVLRETGNKKYANKEEKKALKLVALQIKNNTNGDIRLKEHAKFYMGDNMVLPIEPAQLHQQVKQIGALYMLWSLLFLNITNCDKGECSNIPIPIGLAGGLMNWSVASKANKNFMTELITNNILDKTIAPGETVTGLIGLSADASLPIEIRISQ
ncbi:MAG: hypothetical protein KDC93_10590 [Cyclobacteriaceae bacterium]|nr:hypothetical protein [Cyclobacteriaceae bacterium]